MSIQRFENFQPRRVQDRNDRFHNNLGSLGEMMEGKPKLAVDLADKFDFGLRPDHEVENRWVFDTDTDLQIFYNLNPAEGNIGFQIFDENGNELYCGSDVNVATDTISVSVNESVDDNDDDTFVPKNVEDRENTPEGKKAVEERARKQAELNALNVQKMSFAEFKKNFKNQEGIVLLGAGGDILEWIGGVTDVLNQEQIVAGLPKDVWSNFVVLTTSGGRTDLAMTFNPNARFNMGKMAMWRLRFGDCSWISDYLVNYAKQH